MATTQTRSAAAGRFRPLMALQGQIVALDAAMLVAVTATEVGAVHKLRTTTRRVEAQLDLLHLLGGGERPFALPPHDREAHAVHQGLRRVRRAAGTVRDFDVQSSAIRMDAPLKTSVHKGSPGDTIRRQAKALRKHLDERRDAEALKLVEVLKAEEQALAAALRAFEEAVEPARNKVAPAGNLIARIESHFAARVQPFLRDKRKPGKQETADEALQRMLHSLDEDALHTIRKAAKACRYMAESAPEGSTARTASARYEVLQEAGGRWHDWLLLQQLSAKFHGGKAELTQRYRKHANAALADYYLRLTETLPAFRK